MKYFAILLAAGLWVNQSAAQNTTQERAFLGIESNRVSKEKAQALGFANPFGSYVSKVFPNTAAEKAGIRPLDYVYGINEDETSETENLASLIGKYKAGEKATIRLYRKGKDSKLSVTFGPRSDAAQREKAGEKAFLGINRHPDNDDNKLGVRIYALDNSTAKEMGLQDGDLITAINGYPMADWDDITTAIGSLSPGEKIAVEYERDGKKSRAEQAVKSRTEEQPGHNTYYQPQSTAFLGIFSEQLPEEKARKLGFDNLYGSYVSRVVENSAAERAGVQPFDYIYGIDEYRTGKEQDLTKIIHKYKPDQAATLYLYRKGGKRSLKVTFGARTESKSQERDRCQAPFFGISARRLDGKERDGVAVNIVDNSTAKAIGMEDGDQIININGYLIIDWQDISTAVNVMEVGDEINVEFIRNSQKMKKRGPIKSYCETKPDEAMNKEIRVAPQPGEWFDRYFKNEEGQVAAKGGNEQTLRIEVQQLGADEAASMKREKGIDLDASNSLAVEDFSLEQDEDALEMEFTLPNSGETTIRIYNQAGRMVYQYGLGNFSGEFRDEVNLAQNGMGQYFLEIRQGNKTAAKKLTLSSK